MKIADRCKRINECFILKNLSEQHSHLNGTSVRVLQYREPEVIQVQTVGGMLIVSINNLEDLPEPEYKCVENLPSHRPSASKINDICNNCGHVFIKKEPVFRSIWTMRIIGCKRCIKEIKESYKE
jgi:hypothetical protein